MFLQSFVDTEKITKTPLDRKYKKVIQYQKTSGVCIFWLRHFHDLLIEEQSSGKKYRRKTGKIGKIYCV